MSVLIDILRILIFPGFLFLAVYSMLLEFVDRKLYARMQNRMGPPWYQPAADFLKLLGKEAIVPSRANRDIFRAVPVVCLAAMATAFIYIPIWGGQALFSFKGDMIVVLYLLAIPPLAQFIAGWYSRSIYATVGSTRILTQMFSYEVPLFMCFLSPTLLSGSWSLSGNAAFYSDNPLLTLVNIPALCVAIVAIQCKLERTPFDAPEAETEIVSGSMVEYGGRYLAFFRFAKSCEMTVIISMLSAVFIPFMTGICWLDFILYIVKTLAVLFILTLMRAVTARLKIDQIVSFCWKILAPIGLLQILLNIIIRGVIAL